MRETEAGSEEGKGRVERETLRKRQIEKNGHGQRDTETKKQGVTDPRESETKTEGDGDKDAQRTQAREAERAGAPESEMTVAMGSRGARGGQEKPGAGGLRGYDPALLSCPRTLLALGCHVGMADEKAEDNLKKTKLPKT